MSKTKEDIFDKIMSLPILKFFKPFYLKHKEILLYLFFGALAVLLNLCLYLFFNQVLSINELIANVICWVICVLFQFFTNRTWVFKFTDDVTQNDFAKQLLSFFSGRIATLVIEEVFLGVFITWLAFNSLIVKLIAQIITIVLNYIISKLIVFRR